MTHCNLCSKNILRHAHYLNCAYCYGHTHIKCLPGVTANDSIYVNRNQSNWLCPVCSAEVFPFNHYEDDTLFYETVSNCFFDIKSRTIARLRGYQFNPFELNEDNLNLPHMDSDPDLQYFNDVTYIETLNKCDYYMVKDFNAMIKDNDLKGKSSLSFMHLNIRSLPKHASEFEAFMAELTINFDIIGITETWLTKSNSDLYDIDIYTHFNQTRNGKMGGGVSLFVRSHINCVIRSDLCLMDNFIEVLFVEMPKRSSGLMKKVLIGVVYRPPNSDIQLFIEKITELLNGVRNENKTLYLMGDFNINILAAEDHLPTSEFLESMYSYGLFPLISKPTRMTQTTETLIDNIFTNDVTNSHCHQGIFFNDISDHFPVFHIINVVRSDPSKKVYWARTIDDKSINDFMHHLYKINWTDVLHSGEGTVAFELFYNKFSQVFENIFPLKKIQICYKTRKNWLSRGLKKSIATKNKLYLKSLKTKSEEDIMHYKAYKVSLKKLMKNAERQHYQTLLSSNKENMKKLWVIIKDVINKKKSSNVPSKFSFGDEVVIDKNVISNKFNDYFTNIGRDLANKIPEQIINPLSYIQNDFVNTIVLNSVTENEVRNIVKSLKNTSAGWDGIHSKIIKKAFSVISKPLTHVLNLSFMQGFFPDSMKLARVIPLFKSGNSMLISNYRPVSILPVLSKLLEKLMYNRLIGFINEHDILYKYQFGFRNKHSTSMALITPVDHIMSAVDNSNMVLGVFLDFKKAFDTVNHNILLKKLYKYGIRGIAHNWIKDYLSNRYQYVVFEEFESQKKLIKCGVPQGSILGPLLFLLYINDLPAVSDIVLPIIFADDTNVFLKGRCIENMIGVMNTELEKIYKWLNANKLSLNINKTQYMIFHSRRTQPIRNSNLTINGIRIEYVEYTKFLGVHIDSCMTWEKHIHHTKSKIARGIAIISKARQVFNVATLITLYYSFIYPYLTYCIEVWGKAPDIHLQKLFQLQKRGIKIIKSAPFRAESVPIFK